MPRQMMPMTHTIAVANMKICGLNIPFIDQTTALIYLILNLIFPGFGTMLIGCTYQNPNCCKWVLLGFAQSLTGICCVGWIWAIVTSVQVLQYSQGTTQMANIQNMQNMQNMNSQMSAVVGRPVQLTEISQ